uniref:C-type lectin domain-containing protein n=1 Tax=Nothobranchius furzeri TaxID=105023 RepID=A0A8C6KIB2_NOTFU
MDRGKKKTHPVSQGTLRSLCILHTLVKILLIFFVPSMCSKFKSLYCHLQSKETHEYFKQGWVYIQPSLYYISSTRKTWQESREDCLQREADLAVINTKEEQDFTRQFHKLTWIGLYNNTVTGEWTWVDGTPLKKSYWGTGEPNKFEGKDEGCVEIRFFELENSWNDIPCIDRNFWICEKKYYI